MGIKKIARPINKAKNEFVKWLEKKGATNIDVFEGTDVNNVWDYYRQISYVKGRKNNRGYFEMWKGVVKIDLFTDNDYTGYTLEEFNDLIK
jgi:hypothetical protein